MTGSPGPEQGPGQSPHSANPFTVQTPAKQKGARGAPFSQIL